MNVLPCAGLPCGSGSSEVGLKLDLNTQARVCVIFQDLPNSPFSQTVEACNDWCTSTSNGIRAAACELGNLFGNTGCRGVYGESEEGDFLLDDEFDLFESWRALCFLSFFLFVFCIHIQVQARRGRFL